MTGTIPQTTAENRKRLALIGAGVLLLLLLLVVLLFFLIRGGGDVPVSTIYLIDSSQRMGEPLSDGEVTRLGAAQGFVRDVVSRSSNDTVLGLRAFGSGAVSDPCEDTELLVAPAAGRQSEIVTGIDDLRTVSEEAALIPGAIAAIRDLAQLEEQGLMRLVIVTGGDGTCLNQSIDLLVREANREDINLETIIINIGPAGRDVVALRSLVEELEGAVLIEAEDPAALGQIGELIEEGGINEVATLVASNPTATLSTSTPLPSPTNTPLPEPPTIVPTNTSTPAAPAPSATPVSQPTAPPAEATSTPGPTTTAGATSTAGPTNTPIPTSTPTAIGLGTPTNTPRPTFTPLPTATPTNQPPPPTNPPPPPSTATSPPPTSPPPTSPPPTSPPPPTPTVTFTPVPPPTSPSPSTLAIQDETVSEGPGAFAYVSVLRSSPPDGRPVTVNYSVLPNTALAGSDYTPVTGQLSWGPQDVGARDIEIPIINDPFEEGNETFTVIINNAVNATISRASATVTIVDDDVPTINHTQQHFYITESSGSVSIEFSLGSSPSSPVRIPLINFSASFCTIAVNEIVIDSSNFRGASIPVTILDDSNVDGDPSNLCYIQTDLSSSADPEYDSINPADFNINIFDDDALYVTTQCTDNVGGPECDEEALVYRTVQAAVNQPSAINTIYIERGTYTESGINLTRNLTISGDGANNSIVQGAATAGSATNRVFNIPAGRTITISNIAIKHGTTAGNGGGIANGAGSILTLQNVAIDANQAAAGGGIDNLGSLFIVQSTISRNTGGGVQSVSGFELRNSTVSSNTGPGITMVGGTVTLKNSTIAFNTGAGLIGTIQAQNSIIDQNAGNCSGTLTSSGHNLGNVSGCSIIAGAGDQFGVSANLGGLALNGGPTQTHLPLAGSPAIEGGNPAGPTNDGSGGSCLIVDQRGTSRPVNARCDIGSVEQ